MDRLTTFIVALRLPFQLVEHPEFRALIEIASSAPTIPEIPSARTIRRHLQETVRERQDSLLQTLPEGAKLSIALDCWTSPFRQAFMAVTGYFIDLEWNYREILLGFEPLRGSHIGAYLSSVLLELLEKHQITNRVLTITTDNASNNDTLLTTLEEAVSSLELPGHIPIIRIPCIAHVIQLSLKELLGQMDANPLNDREEMEWADQRYSARQENRQIVQTLNKVYYLPLSTIIFLSNTNYSFSSRFGRLQSISIEAPSAARALSDCRQKNRNLCQSKMSEHAGIPHFLCFGAHVGYRLHLMDFVHSSI